MKKNALGKGLNALIKDIPLDIMGESDENDILEIPLEKIKPNPNQPRKKINEESLKELAESIKENGIIQPILVTEKEDYYQIVIGERRYRAAIIAELTKIPCIIKQLTEQKILELALVENLQREDLNPMEAALSYQELLHKFNMTQEDISKTIGKSRSAVANTLRLLKLPDKLKEDLMNSTISEGHARAILMLEDIDKMLLLRDKIVHDNLSVRETEGLAKKLNQPIKEKQPTIKVKDVEIMELENKFTEIIGTKVVIHNKGNKGKIEIEYYSLEDFEKIKNILESSKRWF